MNKIITTDIVDPSIQQPFTGPSLEFLQNATKSVLIGYAEGMIGSGYTSSNPYIFYGLQPYGTNQISSGFIFWDSEMFFCVGKATTTAFSGVAICTVTETADATADPVEFSDGVFRNVHKNRTIVISDDVSGSGDFDLSDAVVVNSVEDAFTEISAVETTLTNSINEIENPESWISPTLAADWTSSTAGYYKDASGIVRLKGNVQYTQSGAPGAKTIFTLPVGYRPVYGVKVPVYFSCPTNLDTFNSNSFMCVSVDSSGAVIACDVLSTAGTYNYDLSSITFRLV